jgi:hypothetical protein
LRIDRARAILARPAVGRRRNATDREEALMTKTFAVLSIVAVVVAGVGLLSANASPLTGAANSLAALKSYSTVEKAGCIFGTRRCKAGTKWSCVDRGTAKACVCRPC